MFYIGPSGPSQLWIRNHGGHSDGNFGWGGLGSLRCFVYWCFLSWATRMSNSNVKKILLVFFVATFFCKFEVTRVQMQPKEILDDFPSSVVSSDRISMFKICFLWISWSHTERSRHQLTDGKLVVLRLSSPHSYEVLSWFRSRGCNQGLW